MILVSGAAGFIGSHLVEALLEGGRDVVGFDNFDPTYPRWRKERNLVVARGHRAFRFVEADLRDARAVRDLFGEGEYDAVVHLAARAGVRASMADPAGFAKTNVGGTRVLLEEAARSGTRSFVFASSSSVYGDQAASPFREDAPGGRLLSPYAHTKRDGEDLCRSYAESAGLHTLCLRFFTVYGPRQRPDMAIHDFTRRVIHGLDVPLFGDGSMERDFTYVDDIVAGVAAAVEHVPEHACEIVNLGSGTSFSLDAMLAMISEVVGKPARVVRQAAPPGDVHRTLADVGRARRLLGYDPAVPLREGIERFVEWVLAETVPQPGRREAIGA